MSEARPPSITVDQSPIALRQHGENSWIANRSVETSRTDRRAGNTGDERTHDRGSGGLTVPERQLWDPVAKLSLKLDPDDSLDRWEV
jgi:hypothetical protein